LYYITYFKLWLSHFTGITELAYPTWFGFQDDNAAWHQYTDGNLPPSLTYSKAWPAPVRLGNSAPMNVGDTQYVATSGLNGTATITRLVVSGTGTPPFTGLVNLLD